MSGDGFEVEPQTMRDAGGAVSDVASRFLNELDGFEARMTGYGEPWGADDIGFFFGVFYTEVAAYVFDCLGVAVDEIGSAGGDLTTMADAYDRVDEDGAGTMRSLAGGLG